MESFILKFRFFYYLRTNKLQKKPLRKGYCMDKYNMYVIFNVKWHEVVDMLINCLLVFLLCFILT